MRSGDGGGADAPPPSSGGVGAQDDVDQGKVYRGHVSLGQYVCGMCDCIAVGLRTFHVVYTYGKLENAVLYIAVYGLYKP